MAGKNWGPFTGTQLTMMFVSVVLALAVPGSLWAVAASAVSVTDAANGHTAAVSSARRLFVSALNEGTPTPASYFHSLLTSISKTTGCKVLFAPPAGTAAVVTAVRLDVYENPTPGTGNFVELYSDTTCGTILDDVNPPTIGHFTVRFEPGFATRAGISARAAAGVSAEAFADGYLVPAVQVPAS